jgi:hypothetical protein
MYRQYYIEKYIVYVKVKSNLLKVKILDNTNSNQFKLVYYEDQMTWQQLNSKLSNYNNYSFKNFSDNFINIFTNDKFILSITDMTCTNSCPMDCDGHSNTVLKIAKKNIGRSDYSPKLILVDQIPLEQTL